MIKTGRVDTRFFQASQRDRSTGKRPVEKEGKWPFWLKATVSTTAGVGVGLLVNATFTRPVSPNYRIDPSLCLDNSPIRAVTGTCNPLKGGCAFDPMDRVISLMTVADYRNEAAGNHFAGLVNELDDAYSKKWGLEHRVISDLKKFVDKPCTDPLTLEKADCSPHFYKIYSFVQACDQYDQNPSQFGNKERWLIAKDADMPPLRHDICPYNLIDSVRVDKDGNPVDTSVIMPVDSYACSANFLDLKNIDPSAFNPNTGFIAGRIDKRSCPIYRKWWEARDAIPKFFDRKLCRSLGMCSSQKHGLHEQQAVALIVDDHPCMKDQFTVRKTRDKAFSGIVINSVYGHDKYCFKSCGPDGCGPATKFYDTDTNPDAIYRSGDAWSQPNAMPMWGKVALKINGQCPSESEWDALPIEQVRLRMIKEMCADSPQKDFCDRYFSKHPTDKIVTANLWMGLGNQLFQAAAAYAHALEIGGVAIFPNKQVAHVGTSPVLDRLNRGFAPFNQTVREHFKYIQLPDDSVELQGMYQSYKYFDHRRNDILELFKPSDEIRTHLENKYSDLLKQDTVAIHVRRGDYLTFTLSWSGEKELYNLSEDPTYYENALKQFDRENQHFVVFSDDLEFAKNMPAFKGLKHITFIEGQKAHEDFYLMSMCKNHIIANSTFSWWAAYLSQNKNVVCPVKWFGPGAHHTGMELIGNYRKIPEYIPMPHWRLVE